MKKVDKDKAEETFGLFKFKVPNKEEQISALSLAGESTVLKKIITTDIDRFYDQAPRPEPGDWLMERKEFGQTHLEYLNSGIVPVKTEKDIIYLTPLSYGENVNIDQGFVTGLLLICEAYFYGMKVKILDKKIDLNNYPIEIRMNVDTNKIQFSSNEILRILSGEIPENAYCLIAFTDQDLFNDPFKSSASLEYKDKGGQSQIDKTSFNYCYGNSNIKKRVGVFSFARYDPLFYVKNLKSDSEKQQEKLMKYFFILFKRACKVMVKEITHMFGIKNCIFYSCNLNGFNSMEEFDRRPLEICPVCLRKLYSNLAMKSKQGLNSRISNPYMLFDRFVKIKDSLNENFPGIFEPELVWYSARIDSIKEQI